MAIRLRVCGTIFALLAPWILGCGGAGQVIGDPGGGAGGAGDEFEVITFLPPLLPFYAPPHVDGDRELDGNGPDMTVLIDLHVVDADQVHATVHIDAVETRWDWTRASGTTSFLVHNTSKPIVSIDSPAGFEHHYRDTDHARDVFDFPEGSSLVKTLTCVGDTIGREAGTKTGCSAELHPITLTLRD